MARQYSSGRFAGFQWSAFNYAGNLHGVQLGLINFADTCDKGLQIGFINIMNETQRWFRNFPNEVAPAMIFLNWRLLILRRSQVQSFFDRYEHRLSFATTVWRRLLNVRGAFFYSMGGSNREQ